MKRNHSLSCGQAPKSLPSHCRKLSRRPKKKALREFARPVFKAIHSSPPGSPRGVFRSWAAASPSMAFVHWLRAHNLQPPPEAERVSCGCPAVISRVATAAASRDNPVVLWRAEHTKESSMGSDASIEGWDRHEGDGIAIGGGSSD